MTPGSPEAAMGLSGTGNALVMGDFSFRFTVPAAELSLTAFVQDPDWVVKAIRVTGLDVTDTALTCAAAGTWRVWR